MKFAELLVDEIADGLQQPTADDIEDELVALGLIEYVASSCRRSGRNCDQPPE